MVETPTESKSGFKKKKKISEELSSKILKFSKSLLDCTVTDVYQLVELKNKSLLFFKAIIKHSIPEKEPSTSSISVVQNISPHHSVLCLPILQDMYICNI